MSIQQPDFIVYVHERVLLGDNQGTYLEFLAASCDISEKEAKNLMAPEIAAGRLEFVESGLGLMVRRPEQDIVVPHLHLNGSGYDNLFKLNCDVTGSLRVVLDNLSKAAPHGRD